MYVIDVSVDLNSVDDAVQVAEQMLVANLKLVRNDALGAIANEQALAYTATSNPPALDYERTLALQRASKTRETSNDLPEISGEWYIDSSLVDYGEYVLGEEDQQAEIHQGRWKSAGQVTEAVDAQIPVFVNKRFK